jgi:hypothetical protein
MGHWTEYWPELDPPEREVVRTFYRVRCSEFGGDYYINTDGETGSKGSALAFASREDAQQVRETAEYRCPSDRLVRVTVYRRCAQ